MTAATETTSDLIAWLLEGAIVVAPDETVSMFIYGDTLRIYAELDATERDKAWVQRYAELAGGGSDEPYEPGIDCFVVTITDGSPLAKRASS